MFGNGSDGAFNQTSGTGTLALNTKHQFTTFNLGAGATLETAGAGAVLYILATESITIDGSILAKNTLRGQISASVEIDGITYTAPGTASGGGGGDGRGGNQGLGFGGGGAGGYIVLSGAERLGGIGGSGGSSAGLGGPSRVANDSSFDGANGGVSSGGSGAAMSLSGTVTSGRGGNAYGQNGANATGTNGDSHMAGGGGGAGGQAGTSGVHIILKAPVVNINGTINSTGTEGSNGGDGGARFSADPAWTTPGSGGGGGGGANAGDVRIFYKSIGDNGTYVMSGQFGGFSGFGRFPGSPGENGTAGTKTLKFVPDTLIPVRIYNGTAFVPALATTYDGAYKYIKMKAY